MTPIAQGLLGICFVKAMRSPLGDQTGVEYDALLPEP